uniref:AVL9 homolog (S. cerevisiase) n=1 Tax=Neogobius melanostomus TaxID=47308 RepID=A0A8C6STU2_9GOBI
MDAQDKDEAKGPVLHIVVVGFHHKKGCQVEFSYPPLVPDWRYLPFLALPDGAHNYQEDTVFFHLPPLSAEQKCVYGVSCYRQIEAKTLKVRQADVTRETVQKSVCVLSRVPLYGLLQAKLQLITHAYFEEKDFSQISILKELYEHMNGSLRGSSVEGSQVYLGQTLTHLYYETLKPLKGLYRRLGDSGPGSPGRDQGPRGDSGGVRVSVRDAHHLAASERRRGHHAGAGIRAGGGSVRAALAIFTKGYLCLPYMALQQHHLLSDVSIRGFVAGATNILFRQQRHLSDAIVEVEEARIQTQDLELRRALSLTTADLRFVDYLVKHVTENRDDVFLDGTGWEGGDEWIRAQFTLYLHSLWRRHNERLLADYGAPFITAWRMTHNYRVWISNKHPFQGQYSVADVKLRLSHSVQNSERGKKIGNAMMTTSRSVVQTGKAVGQSLEGALTSAKSAMSSWFSTLATPSSITQQPDAAAKQATEAQQ